VVKNIIRMSETQATRYDLF